MQAIVVRNDVRIAVHLEIELRGAARAPKEMCVRRSEMIKEEFAAGKPELLEEERRLLYVAMTRARNELHLCAPLKYQVTQQPKDGDKHVYGAKSRFMTDRVLESCERITLRNMRGVENLREGETATVDVVAQLKEMW